MFADILKKDGEVNPFTSQPQTCTGCLWRVDGFKCDAFPEGVPLSILLGDAQHYTHYEDAAVSDEGLTFSPDPYAQLLLFDKPA